MPETLMVIEKSFLFGFVTFFYLLEDRRPDCDGNTGAMEILIHGYKYKHQLKVKVFSFKFSIIIHSINPGLVWVNDKEIHLP